MPEANVEVETLHCGNCGRFLCYYAILEGSIKLKCKSCKMWTTLDVSGDPV